MGNDVQCLWLTLADPEPRHNGQFIYSGGLIDALEQAGVRISVIGLTRGSATGGQRDGNGNGVTWRLAESGGTRGRWRSLLSPLPNVAWRCFTQSMRKVLDELLRQRPWDAIVFDGISVGWALPYLRDRYGSWAACPRLVYVSHNHEESVRASIASRQRSPLRRVVAGIDALKVASLERRLVSAAALVTAITDEDCDLYRAGHPTKPFAVVTPGYDGRRVPRRHIGEAVPRRAVIVGSFDWIAKRMNLEEFVEVADPIFAEANATLLAVGSGEEAFLDRLRSRFKATEFTGSVADVGPYLDDARVAIVPELNGGGFKLKVLDYVFNRVPVFALSGSFAGVPLVHNESAMLFPTLRALSAGVVAALDDLELLNRLHERAYADCAGLFDWSTRGQQMRSAVQGP